MSGSELTICSVSFRSKFCLELNWELACRTNESEPHKWIVVENTEGEADESISQTLGSFRVLEGVPNTCNGIARGSYHHAAALNKSLQCVETRFALLLDPDYFIVCRGWISLVLSYMREKGIHFFGASYFPNRSEKYRYFPCASCLFIDLKHVDRSSLDFMPEINELSVARGWRPRRLISKAVRFWSCKDRDGLAVTPEMARCVLREKSLDWILGSHAHLARVAQSRDVGYRVYRQYSHESRHTSECLVPVWDNPLFRPRTSWKKAFRDRMVRWFVPDSFCPFPLRKRYRSSQGFRDFGLPDVRSLGWEEYMWRGVPFGFHVRGIFQGSRTVEWETLKEIVDRIGDGLTVSTPTEIAVCSSQEQRESK